MKMDLTIQKSPCGFKDSGFIETQTDYKGHTKMQVSKKINGIVQKCFCVKEVIKSKSSDATNSLN